MIPGPPSCRQAATPALPRLLQGVFIRSHQSLPKLWVGGALDPSGAGRRTGARPRVHRRTQGTRGRPPRPLRGCGGGWAARGDTVPHLRRGVTPTNVPEPASRAGGGRAAPWPAIRPDRCHALVGSPSGRARNASRQRRRAEGRATRLHAKGRRHMRERQMQWRRLQRQQLPCQAHRDQRPALGSPRARARRQQRHQLRRGCLAGGAAADVPIRGSTASACFVRPNRARPCSPL